MNFSNINRSYNGLVNPTIDGYKPLSRTIENGKGNPYHDSATGQFTSGPSGKASDAIQEGIKSYNPNDNVDGGFTVDMKSGTSYELGKSDGYAVGGYGSEKVLDSDTYNDPKALNKAIKSYIKQNREAFAKEGASLGGWIPSEGELKGKLVLDVSRVYKSRQEAAIEMVKTDQDSITDFKGSSWPSQDELVKEFGLEDLQKQSKGQRAKERNK